MGLSDYAERLKAAPGSKDSDNIYYLSAPSRQLAELSPYMEAVNKRDLEVLYCYEPYDELVLMNLAQFSGKTLKVSPRSSRDPCSSGASMFGG